MRRLSALALALTLSLTTVAAAPTVAQTGCDPFQTPPEYDPAVPRFGFGETQMTVAEIDSYLTAVDGASDRVITAEAAKSVDGKSIRYAIVGTPDRVTPEGLAAIQANLELLRNPQADPGNAVQETPAILWVSGNVHGGEESGADASLHALYELASRSDCVVDEILANALVVILPTQNPDGRELGQRRNQYGFDMNRDWFARTQPETDGKLEVVRAYPPMLYIDAHEFGLSNYFFPPNADPEYHEIPDTAHDWINELYSPAIVAEFDRQGIKYFHGAPYDFFAIVFGDTVPTEGFHAAGMTFEKESGDPISEREHEQFTSIWASLFAGATGRADIVEGWRDSWVEAYQQGVAGTLEENNVFEPRHDLYQEVPDVTVRGYFLEPDPDRAYELQLLVRRLQRMDVEVRRLTAPTPVADFHPYGDGTSGDALLVPGTYWIPLAQAQKHWIQAMLHEDSWIPFDVTYDVTAWSNPLLMNLAGGWSGADVDAPYEVVAPMDEPEWPLPADLPAVALLENDRSTRGFEAAGQTRYVFNEVWHLPHTDLTYDDVGTDPTVIDDFDVLVMPDGYAGYALQDLGAKGKKALSEWVNTGGRIVAWQGGAEVAVKAGASSAKFGTSHTNMPGALVRVALDPESPLADGIGDRNWVMYQDDRTMQPGLGVAVATFPASGDPAYATSGLAIGVETLTGSSAVVDEAVGGGRVVAFSVDPNFRAWTQGTQRMLWNAIVGEDPAGVGTASAAGSRVRAAAEKAAQDAAAALPDVGSAIRIRVARADAVAAAKVLKRHAAEVTRIDLGADTLFLVANRQDLSYDEHPFFGLVVRDLERAGIAIGAASLP